MRVQNSIQKVIIYYQRKFLILKNIGIFNLRYQIPFAYNFVWPVLYISISGKLRIQMVPTQPQACIHQAKKISGHMKIFTSKNTNPLYLGIYGPLWSYLKKLSTPQYPKEYLRVYPNYNVLLWVSVISFSTLGTIKVFIIVDVN